MKTVVIDFLVNGMTAAYVGTYNPVTGQTTTSRGRPIDADDILKYQTDVPEIKQQFYSIAKKLLAKGGFYFDASLWQWHYERPNAYEFQLWAKITWTDPNNEGKTAFMGYIKQTGFLEFTHKILKSYS